MVTIIAWVFLVPFYMRACSVVATMFNLLQFGILGNFTSGL